MDSNSFFPTNKRTVALAKVLSRSSKTKWSPCLLGAVPAQTGLIASQLLGLYSEEQLTHSPALDSDVSTLIGPNGAMTRAVNFLNKTQKSDGLWHDSTWTGVTMPKLEYIVYPYIQEISEAQAIGMYAVETQ